MGIKWSPDQKKVIDLRNRDILVSAAAGSGKTAVLVERIIQLITDPDNNVDVDELLVVTFTKAAADEMKERISKKLNELLLDNPGDANLIKQSTLVQHAMITTIDSFCLFVVRNYFEEIGIEPGFRVGDEVEVALLVKDVLKDVFENAYAADDNETFLMLIDQYSGKNNDKAVRDMVERIYNTSLSAPWPIEWMENCIRTYQTGDVCQTMQMIMDEARAYILSAKQLAQSCLQIAQSEIGLSPCIQTFCDDLEAFDMMLSFETYDELQRYLAQFSFAKMGSVKKGTCDPVVKDGVTNRRDKYKKYINEELKKKLVAQEIDEISEQIKRVSVYTQELVRLAIELYNRVSTEKEKRHMVAFSDMEHFALNILVDEKTKETRPVAKEFRKHFKEIMIDEYQDSNDVQERILTAISGHEDERYNMFMVGDVKQSIYRFRMANPKLFVDKYERFSKDDSIQQRIDLSMNFRSRSGVLTFCNDIFRNLMEKALGDVEYDEAASLHAGNKDYPETDYPEQDQICAEVLLLDPKEVGTVEDDIVLTKAQMEARMVALRIMELKQNGTVKNESAEEKSIRNVKYSDIVILLRSIREYGPVFQKTLIEYGIPCHVDSTAGYFSATEVVTILNLLMLVDNPLQDIPMAAVLKSPIVGLTEEDLAEIRSEYPQKEYSFASACLEKMRALKASEDELDQENSLTVFYELLCDLRERKDLSVHELILYIFDQTGFDHYVRALPGGATRYANLSMLVEKAIDFESTSYRGVFHFIRYIHQMRKYEKDFGEADADGENGDVVHIKTIHKSKGLEYPICFVSGLSKSFNTMDEKANLVIHPEYGIGLGEISGNPRRKSPSLIRNTIISRMHIEALGEELRVLYVALTRAKEKLILTGLYTPKNETFDVYGYAQKRATTCFLDWIIPVLKVIDEKHFMLREIDPKTLIRDEIQKQTAEYRDLAGCLELIQNADAEIVETIREKLSYEYPCKTDVSLKSKYSVSEIKHASMEAEYEKTEEESERPEFLSHEFEPYIPTFARKRMDEDAVDLQVEVKTKNSGVPAGALYGTAIHRMMELLDFAAFSSVNPENDDEIRAFSKSEFARIKASEEMPVELQRKIREKELYEFLKSPVAVRMAKAAKRGELYREKPFVMKQEKYLVQGIIDVFWKENDTMILLDYKTDRVAEADELIIRYKAQLELYADAISRIFGTVSETLIYSYRLKEVIQL